MFLGLRPFVSAVNLSANNINEGQTLQVALNTVDVPNGTTVNYTITGISANDVSVGNLTGTLNILNNQATSNIALTFVEDYLLEGDETISMTFSLSNRATFVRQATLVDFSRPTFQISFEPFDATVPYYSNVSYGVGITTINSGSNTYTFQWQRSINGGSTWSNVISNTIFSGATSNSLSIAAWNADQSSSWNNSLYRCVVKDAVNLYTLTTRAASLSVINPPYGAVISTAAGVDKTWTVPANVYAISAFLVGGGGGGGANWLSIYTNSLLISGGGGGGGTISPYLIKVLPGEVLTIRAGRGGAAGSTSAGPTNIVYANNAGEQSYIGIPNPAPGVGVGYIRALGGYGGSSNSWSTFTTNPRLLWAAGGSGGGQSVDQAVIDNRLIAPGNAGNLKSQLGQGGQGGPGYAYSVSSGSRYSNTDGRSGGGAGGYGNNGLISYGGIGGSGSLGNGNDGTLGAGGGGSSIRVANGTFYPFAGVNGGINSGGGVGILGPGTSGQGGFGADAPGSVGSGGSGNTLNGLLYGGGGNAKELAGVAGGNGAVRIIFGAVNGQTNILRTYNTSLYASDTANTSNTTVL